MPRIEYTCVNCGNIFKRYPSQVIHPERGCCSHKCADEFIVKSGRLSGPNNPSYKHGKHCEKSLCECGNEKDYRAQQCSKCSNSGFAKIGAESRFIDKEKIISEVMSSISFQDIARKTKYSRHIVKNVLEESNIDTSHFMNAKGREVNLDLVFNKSTINRNATLKKYLLEFNYLENKCYECGITNTYNGLPISLQVHHKDGNNKNNVRDNLTFLCPNCHSQTDNFTGRNIKNKNYETNDI